MRLTNNLVEAESRYRDAVRKLRRLGQSVATEDSTHFSTRTTVAPTCDDDYIRRRKAMKDDHVDIWRRRLPKTNDGYSLHDTMPETEQASSSRSIEIEGSYAAKAGPYHGTAVALKEKRAWQRRRSIYNHSLFARRRCLASISNASSVSL
jgi:hypothetical protein